MNIKEWWLSKSNFMKFIYGILIVSVIVVIFNLSYNPANALSSGLRINQSYIKVIEPCKAELNDFYISTMIEFATKCNKNQTFYELVDSQNKPIGVVLWCKSTEESFTFYYSDKWRQK